MNIRSVLCSFAFAFSFGALCLADKVKTTDGRTKTCTITLISRNEIGITNRITKKPENPIQVNTVVSINIDGLPNKDKAQMGLLLSAVERNDFKTAIELLNRLDAADVSDPRITQELAYYRVLIAARAALAGNNTAALNTAGAGLNAFLTKNSSTWHYYQAVEVLGDLYLAIAPTYPQNKKGEIFSKAIEQYQMLSTAPWDDYKMRGNIAEGRTHLQSGNFSGAAAAFDAAIQLGAAKAKEDPLIGDQLLAAKIGMANTLAETSPAKGIALINQVIAAADEENTRLHAMAFLALGKCYDKLKNTNSKDKEKNTKEALMNYLKVDVLYYSYPQYHAEALYHLVRLWEAVNRPDRAKEAKGLLQSRHPNSVWAARANL